MQDFKLFLASFSRSSNGAIETLRCELQKKKLLTNNIEDAFYVLAVGDRVETYNFVLQQWLNGKNIIHLWAGEVSQGTFDEVFRHSITLMSDLQLCTNRTAKTVVDKICKATGKKPNSKIVGNVMLDNMEVDESVLNDQIKSGEYLLVLYNPCSTMTEDLAAINDEIILLEKPYVWIAPNNDKDFQKITQINSPNQPRAKFLGLLKNCNKFITNSSSAYYEAPFFLKPEQIIKIGMRNQNRNSTSGMDKKNATKNIIKAIRQLEKTERERKQTKQVPLDSAPQGGVEAGKEN
jgi:GDP/UDP-N,N'-diacetylbacillosamine 2-epimerase (hydrolysing)